MPFINYYIGINVIGYLVMWLDKQKAKKHHYRISEMTLWLLAFSFASLGMTLGMVVCHHKSQKIQFKVGLPLLSVIQLVCMYYFRGV